MHALRPSHQREDSDSEKARLAIGVVNNYMQRLDKPAPPLSHCETTCSQWEQRLWIGDSI